MGLETAVALSLFLDREAEPDDVCLTEHGPPWLVGRRLRHSVDDRIGSRLWLLSREKQLEVRAEPRPGICRGGPGLAGGGRGWPGPCG
jgi:phage gp46-like protein